MTLPELDSLRRVEAGDVFKAGRLAGTIRRAGEDTVFDYHPDYLEDPSTPAVAFAVPKGTEPCVGTAGAVPAFFAGLLPEGVRLSAITTATRTSVDDQLTLLLAVGTDTVGDVQVVSAGQQPAPVSPIFDEASAGTASFGQLFQQAVGVTSNQLDRTALPGVQDKVFGRMMSTPLMVGGGPAILKLSPPTFPRLVENEAFFLAMAQAAGLAVPVVRLLHDQDGTSGWLVARFDRAPGPEVFTTIGQEDACQVLDRYPVGSAVPTPVPRVRRFQLRHRQRGPGRQEPVDTRRWSDRVARHPGLRHAEHPALPQLP